MRKNLIMIGVTLAVILALMLSTTAKATSSFGSQGKLVFTNKTETKDDDVIFDASDFEKLAIICR